MVYELSVIEVEAFDFRKNVDSYEFHANVSLLSLKSSTLFVKFPKQPFLENVELPDLKMSNKRKRISERLKKLNISVQNPTILECFEKSIKAKPFF